MPQSKTITLQELANIFHQYNAISVHIYSPDGTRVEGPTVNIAYDALPTPSYAAFSVTAHGFTFYITVC